ncbi:MAG TPA: DUF2961 domain-containing protein [Polyangiales bacterium]|nr:DUF2961 domain-containing protein [Polyangiales bacterium]
MSKPSLLDIIVGVTCLTGCASGADPDMALKPNQAAARANLFDWLSLPVAQHRSYVQHSTRDREKEAFPQFDPKNKDFNNFEAVCGTGQPMVNLQSDDGAPCDPGSSGDMLAADDSGPGFVSRIWFAWGGAGFVSERIRVFADDLPTPIYEAPLSSWRNGVVEPFVEPLTMWTSNAIASYVPIAYERKVRVLIDGLAPGALYYNQTNLQRGQDVGRGVITQVTSDFDRLEEQVSSAAESERLVEKSFALAPRQSATVFERAGRGVITQLRFTLAAQVPVDLRGLNLRMQWENADKPAVELPLSSFFGADLAVADYHTLPLSATRSGSDVTFECNWPLPYFEHARISVENASDVARAVKISLQQSTQPTPSAAGHFHAVYRHSVGPFNDGDRYQLANVEGRGKYVGTLVYMQGQLDNEAVAARYPLGFLEGDERIAVDGKDTVVGTGTEDFFDAGYYWGNGRFDSPFATLISKTEDANGGSVTAARWHILTNSIEFEQALDFSFEYGADRPKSATDYASVAYYYLFDTAQ